MAFLKEKEFSMEKDALRLREEVILVIFSWISCQNG